MPNYFDDRKLHGVEIGGVQLQKDESGLSVGTSIDIGLTARGDDGMRGPGVVLSFAIDITPSTSLVDVHNAAFDRALQLLRRISGLSDDELRDAFTRNDSYILQLP